jgi:hypothetical protein
MVMQIEPNFDKAVVALEKQGLQSSEDFLKLYKPMRRNLIKAFECTLNVSVC